MKRRLRDVPKDRLGYYGVQRQLMYLKDDGVAIPSWVWRTYWAFQPLRCRLGWHNWYSVAAGLCSACRCGKEAAHSTDVMHKYRWDRHARELASRLSESEFRAQVMEDAWKDSLQRWGEHLDAEHQENVA